MSDSEEQRASALRRMHPHLERFVDELTYQLQQDMGSRGYIGSCCLFEGREGDYRKAYRIEQWKKSRAIVLATVHGFAYQAEDMGDIKRRVYVSTSRPLVRAMAHFTLGTNSFDFDSVDFTRA